MSGTQDRVSLRIGVEDIDAARAKFETLGRVGDAAMRRISDAGQKAVSTFAGVNTALSGDGLRDRAADITAYGGELDRLRGKFDPVFAASKRYESSLNEINAAERVGAINAGIASTARDRLNAEYAAGVAPMQRVSQAATAMAAPIAVVGDHTRQTAFQMRALAQQMPDVVQGLLTGQSAFQILVQQGGQVVQVTGGVGSAFRTLVGYMGGPYVAASLAAGAALAALTARSAGLINEQRQLGVALRGVGKDADVSAAQVQGYMRALEAQGISRADARATVTGLVRTPGASASDIARASSVAPDLAAATGQDLATASKTAMGLLTGGYEAVKKLDDEIGFLTSTQRAAIRTMLEHGQKAQAATAIFGALDKQIGGLNKESMTPLVDAMKDARNGWDGFMDAIANSRPIMSAVSLFGQSVQGLSMMISGPVARPPLLAGDAEEDQAAALFARRAVLQQRHADVSLDPSSSLRRTGLPALEAQIGILTGDIDRLRGERDTRRIPITPAGGVSVPIGGERGVLTPGQAQGVAVANDDRQRKLVDDLTLSYTQQSRVLAASLPERVRVRAEIAAENEAREKGIHGLAAEELKRRRVAEARATETDARGQEMAAITREGQAAMSLVAAAQQGSAAMLRSKAAAEAHAQAATQTGVAEGALAAAILNRNAAQEAAKGAETIVALNAQNAAVTRLIAAEQAGARAAYYADIETKVIDATRALQAQREVATDPGIQQALQAEIDLIGERIRRQEELNTTLAQTRRMTANDNELADLRDQNELVGASVQLRDRELAQRRAIRQLQREGADPANLTAAEQSLVSQAGQIADANSGLRQQRGLYESIGDAASQAASTVGNALTQQLVAGEGAAIRWGNIWRGVFSAVATEGAKLALINPLSNAVLGTERPSLFSASGLSGGGGFGLGDLAGVSGLLPEGGLSGMLGLSGGLGGLLGGTAIAGWGTSTSAALGAMGGAYGPASLAQLNAVGGGGLMGGAGATFGSLLGGVGAGFGAGMLLNNLLGGNQLGGTIGSGGGALAGALIGSIVPGIGTLIGGLLGGAAGGGLGGLIGPGESVKGYGFRLQSAGRGPDAAPTDLMADSLLPISRSAYNASGDAQFKQADALVAGVNAYLAQRGLQVGGVSIVGGNKNGADYSWADAGSLSEAFTRLRFTSKDEAGLSGALGGKVFDDPAKLQAFVEGFYQVQTAITDLTDTADQKLAKTLDAIGKQFDALGVQARAYGLSETGLADAREKAMKAARDANAPAVTAVNSTVGTNLLRDLAFGQGSVLAPEQQYFAAVSTLNSARGTLNAGGSLDDYTATARQVLPVARDFLGVTERYAALVAEVAGVVTGKGGDAAGLGALLQAQTDGSDALRETFARYGSQQVEVATATLGELRRLAASLEALIARRVA
ncbi:phage tail length tape measure family protein [Sandarakinorhabdus sp.]|uniref:phage tail length tape measure family protein n=1 Tax=Sandarakinorhabdus sp. TaxID=1916663 RepID=UPI0035697421